MNERTGELNRMAAKVKEAERAIARSERDVRALERRQRQLATEKAEVEDARAQLALERDALAREAGALEEVANAFIDCKDGLTELLGYVLAEDYLTASAIFPRVNGDCTSAEGTLESYQTAFE